MKARCEQHRAQQRAHTYTCTHIHAHAHTHKHTRDEELCWGQRNHGQHRANTHTNTNTARLTSPPLVDITVGETVVNTGAAYVNAGCGVYTALWIPDTANMTLSMTPYPGTVSHTTTPLQSSAGTPTTSQLSE